MKTKYILALLLSTNTFIFAQEICALDWLDEDIDAQCAVPISNTGFVLGGSYATKKFDKNEKKPNNIDIANDFKTKNLSAIIHYSIPLFENIAIGARYTNYQVEKDIIFHKKGDNSYSSDSHIDIDMTKISLYARVVYENSNLYTKISYTLTPKDWTKVKIGQNTKRTPKFRNEGGELSETVKFDSSYFIQGNMEIYPFSKFPFSTIFEASYSNTPYSYPLAVANRAKEKYESELQEYTEKILMYGIKFGYEINDNFSLTAGYRVSNIKNDIDKDKEEGQWSGGIRYLW